MLFIAVSIISNQDRRIYFKFETLFLRFLYRIKSHEFEERGFKFEMPRLLTLADIAFRVLFTQYDHLSPYCNSFQTRIKQKKEEVEGKRNGLYLYIESINGDIKFEEMNCFHLTPPPYPILQQLPDKGQAKERRTGRYIEFL